MGTIYKICCHDCKVVRDLDKLSIAIPVSTREEAENLCAQIKINPYRPALLISFMAEHQTHKVALFTEHDYQLYEDTHPEDGNGQWRQDHDFWDPSKQ